jgi:hypothetical protein
MADTGEVMAEAEALRDEENPEWDGQLGEWVWWQDADGYWNQYEWHLNPQTQKRRWRLFGEGWDPRTGTVVEEEEANPVETGEEAAAHLAVAAADAAAEGDDEAWGAVLLL